jgi:RNA polymerase sigma-70 factor (ECF subfamily)
MALSEPQHNPPADERSSARPQPGMQRWLHVVPSPEVHSVDPAPLPSSPLDILSDDELVAAMVAGEAAALAALYDRHSRVVFALIVRIIGNRETAEDLVQEVFFRVWQQAASFDETRGTLRSWLCTIAHNLSLNEVRRRQRRPQGVLPPTNADERGDALASCIDSAPQPSAAAWCAVRDGAVATALAMLPPTQRAVLQMYAAGYSQSEIAEAFGEPLGTIKSRMRRSLLRLREDLPHHGIDAGWDHD